MDTLSDRGRATAATSMRSILSPILADRYNPSSNPDGWVDMGTAENYNMTSDISGFANKHMTTVAQTFTYGSGPWGSERLRIAMARHMTKYFRSVNPIVPDDILFANGLTSICELLGWNLCQPGEGILFPTPVYQAFATDFGAKAEVKCIFTPFHGVDQFSPACVEKYEQALEKAESEGVKVRALLLCNPHNPLGQCYSRETIIALMRFCQRRNIHLISDEIYALSVYDVASSSSSPSSSSTAETATAGPDDNNTSSQPPLPFCSVLSFDTTPYIPTDLLHVLYGFSKDFACGGLRLGCIYTRSEALMAAVGAITQFAWSGALNQTFAYLMLEDEEWLDSFIQKSQKTLAERSRLARDVLDGKGIAYSKGSNAGFFIWVDLRPFLPLGNEKDEEIEPSDAWARERELVRRMGQKKIYLNDGGSMNAEEAGWFRLIFSQESEVIQEGLKRLWEVLGI
ncbi:hypothetical protein AAFC00_004800 [Neodothiora populina]|uniref:Aminotransferase class I/classII large domain-containing protein n=1 Tax=Neodothiora populina TaxID=2781224 RepID=A0ABR3P390_9PEZI